MEASGTSNSLSRKAGDKRGVGEKFPLASERFQVCAGGRILHAIGNPNKVTALNCYVIPSPHDSLPGIYKTALELAETFKRGGGCGVDISSLRPKDSPRITQPESLPGQSRSWNFTPSPRGLLGNKDGAGRS